MNDIKEIKEMFRYFETNHSGLTEGQTILIKSMNKYFKRNKKLSDRQLTVLCDIKMNLK
jgi:hypothetical protein